METDKDLVDSLKSLIKDGGEGDGQDDDGQDDSEEGGSEVDDDEDGRPEDQDEDSMEEEVIEYREEDREPEIGKRNSLKAPFYARASSASSSSYAGINA